MMETVHGQQNSSDSVFTEHKPLLLVMVTALATMLITFLLVLPTILGVSPLSLIKALTHKDLPILIAKLAAGSDENNGYRKAPLRPMPSKSAVQTPLEKSATVLETRQQTFSLVLAPKQSLSIRIFMEQDYDLNYRWSTDGKAVIAELRGQPQQAKGVEYKVFGKITSNKSNGLFITPFTGTYEWRWDNLSTQPVKLRLTAQGAYQVIGQNQSDMEHNPSL